MKEICGIGVSKGYAIGKIKFLKASSPTIEKKSVKNPEEELARLSKALKETSVFLDSLYSDAQKKVGEKDAEIFQIHKMMLEDEDFLFSVKNIIEKENLCAEYAVRTTGENFAHMFSSMEDTYMKERAKDVRDVSDRLILTLTQKNDNPYDLCGIIASDDLTPSQTVSLNKKNITAFITQKGSSSSHTAILARGMNIPAVCGAGSEINSELDGKTAVIDGYSGKIFIDPTDEILSLTEKNISLQKERENALKSQIGKETVTNGGIKINLFSNIGDISDIDSVIENDSEGIGLFRSEFIYLKKDKLPTEEEQYEIFRSAAEKMNNKKIIIRTLDIGADKTLPYLPAEKEDNPAMGLRGIRFCLSHTDIFKSQLRAILRASAHGNISLMLPMVISEQEIISARQIISQAMKELSAKNVPYNEKIEVGIMVETPSSALLSDILSKHVDFFSIGTNDLAQYTLAVDRQNPSVCGLYEKNKEAVLRLIKITAENAKKAGIWVGICGETAADLSLTQFFLDLGITELSVSPRNTLALRKKIREC